MSVETFVPSTKLISLTDSAVKHFESKLKDKPLKRVSYYVLIYRR